jgi:regulator of protease activity HflC (stomatin/prohibitin superfamily)
MNVFGLPTGLILAVAAVLLYLAACVKIVKEYERGVVFFFGRYTGLLEPGLRFVFIPVFRARILDMRTIVEDIPSQDVITRDNVSSKVNAVLYFRVIHAEKAVLQVEDYHVATSQLAQTALRSVVGANELDALLAERERLNSTLQRLLDEQTDPWGIKVASVEIKHVEVPQDMRRVMARQAEAERERRAKVIAAEGELQAAEKLTDAAEMMARETGTLQLRYLQTLVEIASDNHSTTVFPLPLEILRAFTRGDDEARPARPNGRDRARADEESGPSTGTATSGT